MIGIVVGKGDISNQAGQIALALKTNYDAAVALKEFLDRVGRDGLIALGFDGTANGEADVLLSAISDLAYQKATAFDSSAFVKQLYGFGTKV
jgi:hypothetical protein